jgi:signal transduction histidine kinase
MKTRTYLLLMLAAILLPVAGISVLGLSMLLHSERAAHVRSIEEVADSMSLLVDSEIAAAEASINIVANSEDIRQDNFERLHQLLSATRRSVLSWTLIADYDGNGLVNTFVPYGTPLAKRAGGWAARAYDGQVTRVEGYFVGAKSKRGVVSVNVPMPASSGKRYVVTQIFDSTYFNKILRRDSVPRGWIISIADANGITIARNANGEAAVGQRVRPALLDASRRQRSGRLRYAAATGDDMVDVFVRSAYTGWTVVVAVPAADIESASRMTTWYAGLTLFAVLGGAVGIAVFFGRRLDRSLKHATGAASALASGAVTPAARSHLKEANALLDVLHQAGLALSRESAARAALERERERLLESERSARRQAEAQSEAKDHFISMLSHELRNPLAAISGAVTLLRLPNVSASATDKAWTIVGRQLRHLTRMIDDLLDVRRVSSGKVKLERERVNIGAIARQCCDARMLAAQGRHRWDVSTQDAWVLGDRTRLEQIVDNLLTNAVKFTPDGERIAVRTRIEGGAVLVEVSDSGVGIDASVLPTIFDALVQGPTTIDRSQGGLGLGLSIAQRLAEMHGGSIAAHSDGLGKGAVFTIRLPLCETPARTAVAVA